MVLCSMEALTWPLILGGFLRTNEVSFISIIVKVQYFYANSSGLIEIYNYSFI